MNISTPIPELYKESMRSHDEKYWFEKISIYYRDWHPGYSALIYARKIIELFSGTIDFCLLDKDIAIELKTNPKISECISENEFIYWFQTIFWKQIMDEYKHMRLHAPVQKFTSNIVTTEIRIMSRFLEMLQKEFQTVKSIRILLQNINIVKNCELRIDIE